MPARGSPEKSVGGSRDLAIAGVSLATGNTTNVRGRSIKPPPRSEMAVENVLQRTQ